MSSLLSALAAALLLTLSLRSANAETPRPAVPATASTPDSSPANGLHEVVVTGRGVTDEEALKAAFVMAHADALKKLAQMDTKLMKHDETLRVIWQELQPLVTPVRLPT